MGETGGVRAAGKQQWEPKADARPVTCVCLPGGLFVVHRLCRLRLLATAVAPRCRRAHGPHRQSATARWLPRPRQPLATCLGPPLHAPHHTPAPASAPAPTGGGCEPDLRGVCAAGQCARARACVAGRAAAHGQGEREGAGRRRAEWTRCSGWEGYGSWQTQDRLGPRRVGVASGALVRLTTV